MIVKGLVVAVVTGLFLVSSAGAQQQGQPGPSREQQCQSVLPRQAVESILAQHRDRIRAAREAVVREERALRSLLIADTTTRAALDAQIARTNEARNAFARVRLEALWDLRAVIPAQDRGVAFRCAERFLMRGR